MPFNPVEMIVMFLAVTLGATIQGAVGYGMALIVSPVLLLIDPQLIPAPMTVSAFLLVVLITIRDRQALDFFGLKWALLGMTFGIIAGTIILDHFPGDRFALIFSLLILFAVFLSAVGLRFPPHRPILTTAGFISGVMGILTTTSGPPMALVYQDAPGKKLRATLSGLFIIGTIIALSSLTTIGRFGLHELWLALLLCPGTIVGFFLSSRVANWVDRGYTKPIVLALAGISALVVLVTQAL